MGECKKMSTREDVGLPADRAALGVLYPKERSRPAVRPLHGQQARQQVLVLV